MSMPVARQWRNTKWLGRATGCVCGPARVEWIRPSPCCPHKVNPRLAAAPEICAADTKYLTDRL